MFLQRMGGPRVQQLIQKLTDVAPKRMQHNQVKSRATDHTTDKKTYRYFLTLDRPKLNKRVQHNFSDQQGTAANNHELLC